MVNIWVLILAILGLVIASYLYYKNKKHEKLVCILGEDCNKVLNSKYGKLFGTVSNELLGMIYYLIVVLLAVSLWFNIEMLGGLSLSTLLFIITVFGTGFYIILIYIQFFKIREWCSYCMSSAIITFIILIIELLG